MPDSTPILQTLIRNQKKLFLRTSSRMIDTKVMTMIHGHSRQFNSFKHALGTVDNPYCDTCRRTTDNHLHQLLQCPKYNSTIYREPLQTLAEKPKNFMWSLILEADLEQISCFRNMAQIVLHNPNHY